MKKNLTIMLIIIQNIFSETYESNFKEINKEIIYNLDCDYVLPITVIGYFLVVNDENIKNSINENSLMKNKLLHQYSEKFGEFYPNVLLLSASILKQDNKLFRASSSSIEASMYTGVYTIILKNLFSRSRPYLDEDPTSNFLSQIYGKSSYSSFPSGHSAIAFTTAKIFSEYYKDSYIIPKFFYLSAFFTAYSRVYDNKHWASDIFVGGVLGYYIAEQYLKIKKEKQYFIAPSLDSNEISLSIMGKF